MSELPRGWVSATLGELGRWTSGGTPSRSNPEYYGHGTPWIKTGELRDSVIFAAEESITSEGIANSAAHVLPSGTLLVAMYGATIGKLGILGIEAATNQACAALLPNGMTAEIIPLIFQYLLSQRENLKALGQGGAQPNISQVVLKGISCPLPPLPEQRRIVSKIESLTARSRRAKEALDAIPTLLERFRQSVLASAFRGDLTADWREKHPDVEPAEVLLQRIRTERRKKWEEAELAKMRAKGKAPGDDRWKTKYEEPAPVDTSELPELPEGWVWARLPECGNVERGRSRHRPRNDPSLFGGPYPFVQTGDVARSGGRISSYSQTYNEAGLAQSRLFNAGTVCITIAANIADSGILGIDACFPDSVVGVTMEPGLLSPEYLEFYIRHVRSDISAFAPGTAQKNINLEILGELAVPIPPIAERVRIDAILGRLFAITDRRLQEATALTMDLNNLNSSILSKAFRGELVPQDPNDEPAAVLLERIRAEAAKAEGTTKKRTGKKRS